MGGGGGGGEVASILWRLFSTVGDNISAVEGYLKYCGGLTAVHVGIASVLWGITFSTVEAVRDYLQYCGGCSIQWGITSVQRGDSFSTVDGIQYIGDNISTVGVTSVVWRVFSTVGEEFNFGMPGEFSFESFEYSSIFHAFWVMNWCTQGPPLFRNNWQFYFRNVLSLF